MENYILSKHIYILDRKDGYLVFNTLFGKALIIDKLGYEILNEFSNEISLDAIEKKYYYIDSKELNKLLNNFKSRFFIINKTVDDNTTINEYDLIEKEKNRRLTNISSGEFIRALQLIVSNNCNFNCEYCFIKTIYNSSKRSELKNDSSNKLMDFETAKHSIDTLIDLSKKNNHKNLVVEFFGGEPLCNWSLIEKILDTYDQKNYDGPPLLYSMTTNGSLINDEIAEKLGRYEVHTSLSYDSPSCNSRIHFEENNLQSIIQDKLDLLNKYNVSIVLNATLSKQTLLDFDSKALVDFSLKNKVKKIIMTHDLNIEFYDNKSDIDLLIEKTLEAVYYSLEKDILLTGNWHQIFRQINDEQEINMVCGCKACVGCGCKLSVEPTGAVFACKPTSSHLGSIYNTEDLFVSKNFYDHSLRAYENSAKCKGCIIEGFCSGLCMGSIEKKYSSIFNIEEKACIIFKTITLDMLKNYPLDRIDHLFLTL